MMQSRMFETISNLPSAAMVVCLLVGLSACTSQQLYDQTKLQVKTHCNTKVGVERDQCLEKVNTKLYKEYEAERQEIIEAN